MDNNQTEPIKIPSGVSTELIQVNKDVWEQHRLIISHIDDFLGSTVKSTEAINHLLFIWLTKEGASLECDSINQGRLRILLELLTLLSRSRFELDTLRYFEDQVKKEEVNHE